MTTLKTTWYLQGFVCSKDLKKITRKFGVTPRFGVTRLYGTAYVKNLILKLNFICESVCRAALFGWSRSREKRGGSGCRCSG